jgi:NAD(P)-dependent dehydrogenase (short-subunit alcohol dehydrogenase family)
MQKITVITGGAGGMGLATAKLMGQGHHVVICDVNQQRLDSASAELKQLGIHCDSMVCDITNTQSVAALVKFADTLGTVASVIHTAGVSPQMADPQTILKVNALGTINITEAFFAIATEGFTQVNVASMAAHILPGWLIPKRAYPYAVTDPATFLSKAIFRCNLIPNAFYRCGMAYSISKHFVMWYSRISAAKFGQKNARILSVSPGTFDTEMGRLEEKSGSIKMLEGAALKRPGKPEEIATLLAFCASDGASYLTGTDILCDGGVVAGRNTAK